MCPGVAVDDYFDTSIVGVSVFLHDGKSESRTLDMAGIFGAALIERFEHPAAILRKNTGAAIHDIHYHVQSAPAQLQTDCASRWREFDCIRKQIIHDCFDL